MNGTWYYKYSEYVEHEYQQRTTNVYVDKTNERINMQSNGSTFRYGPFSYDAGGYYTNFSCTAYDHNGNAISGGSISGALANGSNSFYLDIPKANCKNGISRVVLNVDGQQELTHYKAKYGKHHYTSVTVEIDVKEFLVIEEGKHFPTLNKEAIEIRREQPVYLINDLGSEEWSEYFNQSDSAEWTDINGTIELEKVDADNNNKKLPGVTFQITGPSINGQYTTGSDGRIYIENVRPGTYSIKETANSNYGYLASSSDLIDITTVSGNIGVTTGQYRTPIETNQKQTGNLVIEKTSKDSGKRLKGFGFKLKDAKGRWIVAITGEGKNQQKRKTVEEYVLLTGQTTGSEEEATEFITDDKGHIEIYNMLIGTYDIVEVSVGADRVEENRFFDVDGDYITWSSNVNSNGKGNPAKVIVTRQLSQDTERIGGPSNKLYIKNERKYIDIRGLVWEDMIDGKTSKRNYLYNTPTAGTDDTKDKLLGNVTVNLKGIDKNGNVYTVENVKAKTKDGVKTVKGTTVTGNESSGQEYYGKYEFQNVLIRKLDEYYIEFIYNGMSYQCIDMANINQIKEANTSKAVEQNIWGTKFEQNSRTVFNNKYKVMENNKATGDAGELGIKYDYANHVSTINFELVDKNNAYGYSGAKFPINYTKDQYLMKSANESTNTRKGCNGGLDQIKSKEEIRKKDITLIDNINLGVYEREQPDIGINGRYNPQTNQNEYGKQLDNVKIKVNGYNHIYQYANRMENQGNYESGFNVGVKFENRRGAQPYTRAIYKADIEFESEDKSREVEVYLTYKITLNNHSSNLKAQVNEIVDYYDARYEKESIRVGTNLKDVADPINPNSSREVRITENTRRDNNYNKIVIDTSKLGYINPQSVCSDSVYVQFKLGKQAVVEILCDGDISNIRNGIEAPQNKLLKNIVEIKSYSIQYNGAVYAGIDQNSNPESSIPGDDTTYEDDTDYSPAIKLAVAKNNREIDGLVFEDIATVKNNLREGDGKYQPGVDKPLQKVEVNLQRKNYAKNGEWETIKTTGANGTKSDGTFKFSDFAAGDYRVTYTWENSNDNKHGTLSTHPEILVQNYKATIFDEDEHLKNTTAVGSEDRTDKHYWYREQERLQDAKDIYEIRKQIDSEISTFRHDTEINGIKTNKMISLTPEIPIGVEYDVTQTSSLGDEYTYEIKSIDFGIVERPLQNYKLTKNVEHIKITLPNGQVLTDADVIASANGTLSLVGVTNNIKPLPRVYSRFVEGKDIGQGYPNGSLELEIDNEVIQGSTLEITYVINIENTSERDYANQDFYEHGTKAKGEYQQDIITITPTKVIDYLDKEWAFNLNSGRNEEIGWKKKEEEVLKAGKDNQDEVPVSKEVYTNQDSQIKDRIILYTDKLARDHVAIMPGQSLKNYNGEDVALRLTATKVLTTIDGAEDIELDNESEVIQIERQGGGVPEEDENRKRIIPGNFVPGSGWQVELDDDKAETFFMTPNTGEDLNYILPITVGMVSLIILITGIIVIKKKVLG